MKRPAVALPLLLSGCGTIQMQPADPVMVQRIVSACLQSGLFKAADGMVAAAFPVAALPIMLINAGVDRVCANPALFAADLSTAEWVVRNISSVLRDR